MSKQYKCEDCGFETEDLKAMNIHLYGMHAGVDGHKEITEDAYRDEIEPRYDLIIPEFEHAMAMVLAIGAKHYGNLNYQKSRLKNGQSPINHLKNHLQLYLADIKYDHNEIGSERRNHLAAIAVNAMFEFYYEMKGM